MPTPKEWLGYALMGFGGGVSGQDFLGTHQKLKQAEKDAVKDEAEAAYYQAYANRLNQIDAPIAPNIGGVIPPTTAEIRQSLSQPGQAFSPLGSDIDSAVEAFRQGRRPSLTPDEGTLASKFVGRDKTGEKLETEAIRRSGKEFDVSMALGQESAKLSTKKMSEINRMIGSFKNLYNELEEVKRPGGRAAALHDLGKMRYAPNIIKEKAQRENLFDAEAQRNEVTIASMPFLSGQARFVVSLAKMVASTVPGVDSLPETRDDLITQSVRNMMTIDFGILNGQLAGQKLLELGIDPDSDVSDKSAQIVLDSIRLTDAQLDAIDQAIEYVLKGRKKKDVKKTKGGVEFTYKKVK